MKKALLIALLTIASWAAALAQDLGEIKMVRFGLSEQEAVAKYKEWTHELKASPDDFVDIEPSEIEAMYLPYMILSAHITARYSGYAVPHYDQKEKKREHKIGHFIKTISEIFVRGSNLGNLDQGEHLKPWNLSHIDPYTESPANGAQIHPFEFSQERLMEITDSIVDVAAEKEARYRIGGWKQESVDFTLEKYEKRNPQCLMLPVYLLKVKYDKETFQIFVNGETGKVYGGSPTSGAKVMLWIFGCLAGLIIVVLIIRKIIE